MPFFEWSDNLSVGIKEMDEQHKRFIDIINKLYDAMKMGKGRDVMNDVLSELSRYAKYHFDSEEALLARYGYPELPPHRVKHENFKTKVNEFLEQNRAGKITISIEVMNFLKDWLIGHIIGTDKRYSQFILERMEKDKTAR